MMRYFLILVLPFLFSVENLGQNRARDVCDALDLCAGYLNESIHGLLVIHRLLENYNQEVNKYVDLPDYQLNYYSNDDLPDDVFEDPEHWFYEVTPHEYLKEIRRSAVLKSARFTFLRRALDDISEILDELNLLRFQIETYLEDRDLTQSSNLAGIYGLLERAESLYDRFDERHLAAWDLMREQCAPTSTNSAVEQMLSAHELTLSILRDIRQQQEEKIADKRARLQTLIDTMNVVRVRDSITYREVRHQLVLFIGQVNKFIATGAVPEKYSSYGKYYYYHNVSMINKVNRYGNGYVHLMNEILDRYPDQVERLECPHFFKVIYPQRAEVLQPIASRQTRIEEIPRMIKERDIVSSETKIHADDRNILLEIYDHKDQDGDIISLLFNGEWILQGHSLTHEPKILRLRLNENGKNYLLVHAENIGRRPPNTTAIAYSEKGVRRTVLLNSDFDQSELIEIIFDPVN